MQNGIPDWYRCCDCGAKGCKLWRKWKPVGAVRLRCASCSARMQGVSIEGIDAVGFHTEAVGYTDLIGTDCPAIPTENDGEYYGYRIGPPKVKTDWWRDLPTLPNQQREH